MKLVIIGNLPVKNRSVLHNVKLLENIICKDTVYICNIFYKTSVPGKKKADYMDLFNKVGISIKKITIDTSASLKTKPFCIIDEFKQYAEILILGFPDKDGNFIDYEWMLNVKRWGVDMKFINDDVYNCKFDPLDQFSRIRGYKNISIDEKDFDEKKHMLLKKSEDEFIVRTMRDLGDAGDQNIDMEFLQSRDSEIIFICGPPLSGKTTFAKRFAKRFGYCYISGQKNLAKMRTLKKLNRTIVVDNNAIYLEDFKVSPELERKCKIILYGDLDIHKSELMLSLYRHINYINAVYKGLNVRKAKDAVEQYYNTRTFPNYRRNIVYYNLSTIDDEKYYDLLLCYANSITW